MEKEKLEEKELKEVENNVLKLNKPVMIDGEEVKEIHYDFDELTGRDFSNAMKEVKKSGYIINGAYEMDPVICCYMFAAAAGIDYLDIERMSAKDYKKCSDLGRNFFIEG